MKKQIKKEVLSKAIWIKPELVKLDVLKVTKGGPMGNKEDSESDFS